MAEKMEILVEKQRRGRSNQKLKILIFQKFCLSTQMLIMILHYRTL